MARKRAVGVDVGTRTITVAEVRVKGGERKVTNFGQAELPEAAVREGEIVEQDAVADTIKELLSRTGIKEKKVQIGIANQRVVVRQIDLPYLEGDELRDALPFQVQEYIPIPVEDAELDYHVLGEIESEERGRMVRIMLVAAAKGMVANHVETVERAGLKPVGVDLNAFSLLRALFTDAALDSHQEVLIDVGAGVTSIVVHERGEPRFVRILVLGGDDLTSAVAGAQGLDFADAEAAKKQVSIGGPDEVARIVTNRADNFVDEIRSSLDYFRAQSGAGRIDRVVLAGGGSLLGGLVDELSSALSLPVELAQPFELTPPEGTTMSDDELRAVGPLVTTAVGLGLGGLE